jgi:hypothetical protein
MSVHTKLVPVKELGLKLEEWRNIPEDAIADSHRRENLKSNIGLKFIRIKNLIYEV